jgi:hypothetical protein
MKLLKIAAKVGIAYFILFSIFYGIQFLNAFQLFRKYHSTSIGIDIAQTITGSTPYFTILAIPAILGAGIWVYQTLWGDRSATSG